MLGRRTSQDRQGGFNSSRRLKAQEKDVPLNVSPREFLGKRTALFGMTRTGRSNSVKKSIQAMVGMTEHAPHELRHTCTCILLLEGVNPKSVAMQMGWSSMAFMLENYARFLPGWGDNGAMDKALG